MYCRNHVDVSEGVRPCARCQTAFCGDCVVTINGRDYCAVCKTEQVMDVRSGTVAGVLPLASIGRRFVAIFLDSMIVYAVFIIAVMVLAFMSVGAKSSPESSEMLGFAIIGIFLVAFLTYIAYEALMLRARGATLGKMMMKIRVVRPDGSEISTGQAWGRTITRVIMVHVLALLNYGAAAVTKEKTCLHDMIAKTRVVNTE